MAGHNPLQTGVNALMPGHPTSVLSAAKQDVDARDKLRAGNDGDGETCAS